MQALRAEFIKSRDITTLSLKTLETYAALPAINTSRRCSTTATAKTGSRAGS